MRVLELVNGRSYIFLEKRFERENVLDRVILIVTDFIQVKQELVFLTIFALDHPEVVVLV